MHVACDKTGRGQAARGQIGQEAESKATGQARTESRAADWIRERIGVALQENRGLNLQRNLLKRLAVTGLKGLMLHLPHIGSSLTTGLYVILM